MGQKLGAGFRFNRPVFPFFPKSCSSFFLCRSLAFCRRFLRWRFSLLFLLSRLSLWHFWFLFFGFFSGRLLFDRFLCHFCLLGGLCGFLLHGGFLFCRFLCFHSSRLFLRLLHNFLFLLSQLFLSFKRFLSPLVV